MQYRDREYSPGRARLTPILLSVIWLGLSAADAVGQDESGYLIGKTYVIRISPSAPDKASLEATIQPWLQRQFDQAGGMLDHIQKKIYPVQAFKDSTWYYVYFDPTRQAKENLFQDNDLLVWFFHGHHVIIQPIEALVSPSISLRTNTMLVKEQH